MKNILNVIRTLLITGVVTILTIIPVMADSNNSNILTHYTDAKGDCITQFVSGNYYTNSNVNIYSMDKIDNTITIIKNDGEFYSFHAEDIDKYYLNEQLNITIDENKNIIEYVADNEPQVYNTSISQIKGNTATLLVNGNKYTFENEEGVDGWNLNEKCKAIIQDGILLEVRPIPLNER